MLTLLQAILIMWLTGFVVMFFIVNLMQFATEDGKFKSYKERALTYLALLFWLPLIIGFVLYIFFVYPFTTIKRTKKEKEK